MKKIILSAVMLGSSLVIPATAAETRGSVELNADPQIRVRAGQPGRRWGQRRIRVTTTTRIVTIGRYRYREVVRVTRYPSGRVTRQVISRTRIGRRY